MKAKKALTIMRRIFLCVISNTLLFSKDIEVKEKSNNKIFIELRDKDTNEILFKDEIEDQEKFAYFFMQNKKSTVSELNDLICRIGFSSIKEKFINPLFINTDYNKAIQEIKSQTNYFIEHYISNEYSEEEKEEIRNETVRLMKSMLISFIHDKSINSINIDRNIILKEMEVMKKLYRSIFLQVPEKILKDVIEKIILILNVKDTKKLPSEVQFQNLINSLYSTKYFQGYLKKVTPIMPDINMDNIINQKNHNFEEVSSSVIEKPVFVINAGNYIIYVEKNIEGSSNCGLYIISKSKENIGALRVKDIENNERVKEYYNKLDETLKKYKSCKVIISCLDSNFNFSENKLSLFNFLNKINARNMINLVSNSFVKLKAPEIS